MPCANCKEFTPIENHELNLCASCNYERRNTDELIWPEVREMFLKMCIRHGLTCPVTGRDIDMSSDIHHKKGRDGYADQWARDNDISLHIDPRFFLACHRIGHTWIEANREEAMKLGYTLTRQDTIQKSTPNGINTIAEGTEKGISLAD